MVFTNDDELKIPRGELARRQLTTTNMFKFSEKSPQSHAGRNAVKPRCKEVQQVVSRSIRQSPKAQYSIVYLLVISGILLFFMAAVFFMTDSFQKTTTREYGTYVLETVVAKVESELINLKVIGKYANTLNISFGIPELIGEQKYLISASGSKIEFRTLGNPSLIQAYNVTFWDVDLSGSVFSSKGKVNMLYNNASNKITLE